MPRERISVAIPTPGVRSPRQCQSEYKSSDLISMVSKLRYTVVDIKVNMTGKKEQLIYEKESTEAFKVRQRVIKKEREKRASDWPRVTTESRCF